MKVRGLDGPFVVTRTTELFGGKPDMHQGELPPTSTHFTIDLCEFDTRRAAKQFIDEHGSGVEYEIEERH